MKTYAIKAYKAPLTLERVPEPVAQLVSANGIARLIVRLGSVSIPRKTRRQGIDYRLLFMRPDGVQLSEIAKLVEAGMIHPVIEHVFPFDETPAAIDHSATGHAREKIVVRGFNPEPVA